MIVSPSLRMIDLAIGFFAISGRGNPGAPRSKLNDAKLELLLVRF